MLDRDLHKSVMVQILKEMYGDTSLGPLLGFKGGTAAFLFYGLDRFSTDLDFDLSDIGKADAVFAAVEKIIQGFGKIREKYNKEKTVFFLLSYAEEAHNIKIEINKRSFGSKYELKNYLGISMLVMEKADMFAHKLVAMTERRQSANRDIYDVWFFFKNFWDVNEEIITGRVGMKYADYLKKCISFLERKKKINILAGMGELMDSEKKKAWVREKLIPETIFYLKLALENEKNKFEP